MVEAAPSNYVVMSLHRWERTELRLTLRERVVTLLTGRLLLNDITAHNSIGWVPVFELAAEAETFRVSQASGAPVIEVKQQLDI